MIQSWIHTSQKAIDFAAGKEMRLDRSLPAGLCVDFDNTKYNPTLGGSVRPETKI